MDSIYMVNTLFHDQLSKVGVDEWNTIIKYHLLGNTKPTNDIAVDEVGYSSPMARPRATVLIRFG